MTTPLEAERIAKEERRYCKRCELPKAACACADARDYDRLCRIEEARALILKEPKL